MLYATADSLTIDGELIPDNEWKGFTPPKKTGAKAVDSPAGKGAVKRVKAVYDEFKVTLFLLADKKKRDFSAKADISVVLTYTNGDKQTLKCTYQDETLADANGVDEVTYDVIFIVHSVEEK